MPDEAPQRQVEQIVINGQPDPHEPQQLSQLGRVHGLQADRWHQRPPILVPAGGTTTP